MSQRAASPILELIRRVAENQKVVRVFDVGSGKLRGEIRGHGDVVRALAFTADGQRLVTGSADRTAKVWELK